MNFNADSLRNIKYITKQNRAKASRKKIILDLIIHEGRSVKKITITAIVSIVKLSRILSMRMDPSADDIFIELLLDIKYGLASSPMRAGIEAIARKPTDVTEKRDN
jgi:hypothetical protein